MADEPNRLTAKSINESALSLALVDLRKVGARSTNDDPERIQAYLDSIEVELDRIKASQRRGQ